VLSQQASEARMCTDGSVAGLLVEIRAVALNFLFGNSMAFVLLKKQVFGIYTNNKFHEISFYCL